MTTDSEYPKRKLTRLIGFDYSSLGPYVVTICTCQRMCLLGAVQAGQLIPSQRGDIVRKVWLALPQRFPGIVLDEFVIMPNHIHGILALAASSNAPATASVGAGLATASNPASTPAVGTGPASSTHAATTGPVRAGLAPPVRSARKIPTLAAVVGAFKSISTIEVNRTFDTNGPALWQRNYYEHIIRSGSALKQVQRYITENPLAWDSDPDNPGNIS